MLFVAAIIASAVLGGAITASLLVKRWKNIVDDTKRDLETMTETYRQHEQENKELRQKNADLQYELNSVKKDLAYERSRGQTE